MPKVKTLQIVWHGKEPVFSVDFHPDGSLATAGADKEIKVWEVSLEDDGYAAVKHTNTLTGHARTVNCVRFSPTGKYLVSAGDCGELILWAPKAKDTQPLGNFVSAEEISAQWRRFSLLCGHGDDVMDLAWSSDGTALLSGAIDNKAIIWDTSGKRSPSMITQLHNHKHFVQGVTWDPMQQFIATQSADRTCKVYALRPPPASRRNKISQYLQPASEVCKEFYCAHTLSKLPCSNNSTAAAAAGAAADKIERLPLFVDDSISEACFFRRPAWSPDGSFLALAAGTYRLRPGNHVYTAFLFARNEWTMPAAHIPAQTKPVVAVRFCPLLFRLQPSSTAGAPPPRPFDKLSYRMMFAVATLDSVMIYDTASTLPLAVLGQLHYASITDLAWSLDGKFLAVASRDGYCSIAAFNADELGVPLRRDEIPGHISKRMSAFAAAGNACAAEGNGGCADATRSLLSKGAKAGTSPAVVANTSAAVPVDKNPEKEGDTNRAGGSGNTTAAAAAVPVASKKRIVPEMIAATASTHAMPIGHITTTTTTTIMTTNNDGLISKKKRTESETMVSGSAEKGPKRITPTPIHPVSNAQKQKEQVSSFENAKAVSSAPGPLEPSSGLKSGHRRITPVPVGDTPSLSGGQQEHGVGPGQDDVKKPLVGAGLSIAALAKMAGQQQSTSKQC